MAQYPLLCKALEHLVDQSGPIDGRTRIMKLVYLADLEWAHANDGRPYTEARYYRWNHGPFSREVLSALEWMDGIEIVQTSLPGEGGEIYRYRSGSRTRLAEVVLDQGFVANLDRVGETWARRPLKDLLEYVYGQDRFLDRAFGEALFQY